MSESQPGRKKYHVQDDVWFIIAKNTIDSAKCIYQNCFFFVESMGVASHHLVRKIKIMWQPIIEQLIITVFNSHAYTNVKSKMHNTWKKLKHHKVPSL